MPVNNSALSPLSSISLPEKLEYIANKYAEHSHDKWSSEKVSAVTVHVVSVLSFLLLTFSS